MFIHRTVIPCSPWCTKIAIVSFCRNLTCIIRGISCYYRLIESQVDRAIKRRRNCYLYAVFRLVARCIFRCNSEVIVCSVRQTGNSNLTLTWCKVGVYFIRCIYHMETIDTHIVCSSHIDNRLGKRSAFKACRGHHRLLSILYRNKFCTEHANLFHAEEVSRFSQRVNTYITCIDAYDIELLTIDTNTRYRCNLFPCSIISFVILRRSFCTGIQFVTCGRRLSPKYVYTGQ